MLPLAQPWHDGTDGEVARGADGRVDRQSLEGFDLSTASCTYAADRELMLGALESAFGTLDKLNRDLAHLLVKSARIHGEKGDGIDD